MVLVKSPARFEVYLVELDPTRGSEIQETRPCAIVSPDEMNRNLRTTIVAPMTTGGKDYPTRVPVHFQGKSGKIALDQLRTVDQVRLACKLGNLTADEATQVLACLGKIFAP